MPFSPSLIPDDRIFPLVCAAVCLKNTFLPHLLGLDSLANVNGNTKGERAIIAIIISLSLPAPIQCENEMAFSSNVLPCAVPRMITVHAQARRRIGSWKTKSGERETHIEEIAYHAQCGPVIHDVFRLRLKDNWCSE